jgi:hypothetical protein
MEYTVANSLAWFSGLLFSWPNNSAAKLKYLAHFWTLDAIFHKKKKFLTLSSSLPFFKKPGQNLPQTLPAPFYFRALKVLSSEIDLDEIMLIRKVGIKERGAAEILEKICPS